MNSFVHLHVHSHYSLLEATSSISGLVDKAIKLEMPAIALTDHGNMFGIKEFYNYTKKETIELNRSYVFCMDHLPNSLLGSPLPR